MESRITIDISSTGLPVIRIDYRNKELDEREPDVRDRLISRFLSKLFEPRRDEPAETKVILRKGYLHEKGMVAFIDLGEETNGETGADGFTDSGRVQHKELTRADNWAMENLTPDLYKKWHTDMFGFPPKGE